MALWNVPLWVVVEAQDKLEAYELAEELATLLHTQTGRSVNAGEPQEVTELGGE